MSTTPAAVRHRCVCECCQELWRGNLHWRLACFGVCCFACDLASGGGVQCSFASFFCLVSIAGWRRQGSGDLERTAAGGGVRGSFAALTLPHPPTGTLQQLRAEERSRCNQPSPLEAWAEEAGGSRVKQYTIFKFEVYCKKPISIPVNPLNIIPWEFPGCKF